MKRALKLLSSCQEKLNSLHIELKDLNIKIYEEKKKKDTCGDSSSWIRLNLRGIRDEFMAYIVI